MKIKINDGNKYYKELKRFFKNRTLVIKLYGKWVHVPKVFYDKLILSHEHIINNKEIDVTLLLKTKELEQFLQYNKKRLDEDKFIKQEYVKPIIEILEKYVKEECVPNNKESSSFEYEYVDFIEFDSDFSLNSHLSVEDDIIYPSPTTTYLGSVLRNLFYNKDVNYAFNKNIQTANSVLEANEIKTGKFMITTNGDFIDIPTKYKVICRAHTKYGECGNVVYFNETHLFNTLKCNLNNGSAEGHTINKPEKVSAWESKRFYSYTGKFISGDEGETTKEFTIYSLYPITQQIITANFLFINSKNYESFLLIVSYSHEVEDNTTIPTIVKKDEEESFILTDIYESIKEYYKKHHNIKITNDNRIVAHYIILLCLCKMILNHKYVGAVFGKSGSGKTFWSRIITNLFSFSISMVKGTNITEAGFLGGKSNVSGLFGKSVWKAGLVETNDLITIDEATELLEKFKDKKDLSFNNNIYYLLKLVEEGSKRGVMGAEITNPNAGIVLFGNLESLKNISAEYRKKVASKYRSYTNGKTYNNNWCLYRPIKYYKEVIKNDELAKAHAFIRTNYYKAENYITSLNEAEQGRIAFFLCIEHDNNVYQPYEFTNDDEMGYLHRRQFMEELCENLGVVPKPTYKFKKLVHDFIIKDYFYNEPNNFITHPLDTTKRQLFSRVVGLMTDLIWLNKHWNKKVTEDLNELEKGIIKYYLKFNYNSLNEDEARMSMHPFENSMVFNSNELDEQDCESKNVYYEMKQKEREDGRIELDSSFDELVDELNEGDIK